MIISRKIQKQLRQAGTAFLEALATVPALAIIFAGALALNAMYEAKLEAKSRARRTAWVQADSGRCPQEPCAGGECSAVESQLGTDGLAALSSSSAGRFSLRSFVGSLGDFLAGTVTHGHGSSEARTPPIVGSGRTTQGGKTTLLCNTNPSRGGADPSVVGHACAAGLRNTDYANEVCP